MLSIYRKRLAVLATAAAVTFVAARASVVVDRVWVVMFFPYLGIW